MYHAKLRIIIAGCLCFLLAVSLASIQAKDPVASKIYLGIIPQDTPNGVVITAVEANSSAADAALKAGDIMLSINGLPVKSRKELQEVIYPTLTPYTPFALLVRRGGASQEITVVPKGVLRLEIKNIPARKFAIPGVPDSIPAPPRSVVEALDQINTLKQVVFDPQTGSIEIVGTYDERFATGPIPYLDLLKTAVQYPTPAMSLVYAPETEALLDEVRVRDDKAGPKVVATRAIMLLLGHPDLERERQALISAYARQYDISAEEYAALYNYFTFDNTTGSVPPPIARIYEKLLRNLGYDEVADAFALLTGNAPDAAAQALGKLGKAPGAYPGSLPLQAYFALQEKQTGKVVQWALDKRNEVAKSDQTDLLIRQQRRLLPEWDKARQKNVNANVLTKLVLSNEASQIMGDIPRSGEAMLVAKDVDPASQLYRILYEADYAMKSRDSFPELFAAVPGSLNKYEYMAMTATNNRYANLAGKKRFWLEPRKVELEISPDKTMVSFGNAEIRMLAHMVDRNTNKDIEAPDALSPDVNWDGWCNLLADNYDAYAQIVPSFHRLREAAKIVALARWINDEHIPVNLSNVTQEKWQPPLKVPGFWSYGFTIQFFETGGGRIDSWNHSFVGGVSFKAKSNWTSYTPATVSETKVSSQLSLSSHLGQKAAQAAISGNLESAKHLAELSAEAMTGALTPANLAKMNLAIPEVKAATLSTSGVQLQKEMIKKTYQQINGMIQNPASKTSSSATLSQLSNLYDQARNNPASASDYLTKLQTGQLSSLPTSAPPTAAPQKPAPTAALPIVSSVCSEKSLANSVSDDKRKAAVAQKLREAREHLKYLNTALKNLAAINAKTRAELEKWTTEVENAYAASQARVWDALGDLLLDAAPESIQKNHEDALGTIDAVKATWLNNVLTEKDPRKLAELKKGVESLDALKKSLTDSKQLLKNYQDLKLYYDVDKGNQEAKTTFDQLKNAGTGIGQILLNQEPIKKALDSALIKVTGKSLDFFNSLYTVGKATNYACGFIGDILRQQFAWKPVMESLEKDLTFNAQAMEKLQRDASQTAKDIDCLELLLR